MMGDPECESFRNGFLIRKAALGSLALKLPVQICRQSYRGFDGFAGVHTDGLLKLRILLRKAIGESGAPVPQWRVPLSERDVIESSLSCIKAQARMQEPCSDFRTDSRRAEEAGAPGAGMRQRPPENAVQNYQQLSYNSCKYTPLIRCCAVKLLANTGYLLYKV
jgi:hypothetical protein